MLPLSNRSPHAGQNHRALVGSAGFLLPHSDQNTQKPQTRTSDNPPNGDPNSRMKQQWHQRRNRHSRFSRRLLRKHKEAAASSGSAYHLPNLRSNRAFQHIGKHRSSSLLQLSRALPAHIQFLTDQKATIAHKLFANWAVIDMLRRFFDGTLPGHLEFLLIDRAVEDLLFLCLGYGSPFGKSSWLVGIFRAASAAADPKQENIFC